MLTARPEEISDAAAGETAQAGVHGRSKGLRVREISAGFGVVIVASMGISPGVEAPLADAWRAAVEHSGLEEADLYLMCAPGAVVEGSPKAVSYEPGLEQEEDEFLRDDLLEEANATNTRSLHRVVVYEDVEWDDPVKAAVLTATLRHELEHARQRSACGGELFAVDQYADDATRFKAAGMSGSSVFYNLKPTEQDANAAAAMLLRDLFGPTMVEAVLDSQDAVLARSHTPPGRLDTLLPRTVCFIYLFADIVEVESTRENGVTFDERLDRVSRASGDLWRHLIAQHQATN